MSVSIQTVSSEEAKTLPNPSLGRIVHYKLTEQDARQINKRRTDFERHRRSNDFSHDGWQAHVGNRVEAGQVYPGLIVRIWPGGYTNLQVFLDGSDVLWATSVLGGEGEGHWIWPPRV